MSLKEQHLLVSMILSAWRLWLREIRVLGSVPASQAHEFWLPQSELPRFLDPKQIPPRDRDIHLVEFRFCSDINPQ